MKKFETSLDFILKAHEAACKEWKAKIEQEFPEAFPKPKITFTENSYDKLGNIKEVREFSFALGDIVKVTNGSYNREIPNGENKWGIDPLFKNHTAKIVSINAGQKSKYDNN